MLLVKHECAIKSRLLYVDGQLQWCAKGSKIFYSQDGGDSWLLFAHINSVSVSSFFSRFGLSARLFRAHIDHLVPIEDHIVVFGFKQIFVFNKDGVLISQHPIFGSRPLSVSVHHGIIYYGEYRSNTERSMIRIFKSKDKGLTWEVAWEFENIRHVHGVYSDPYCKNSIWVTTGDSDNESAIWRTNDNFLSLQKVCGGSQQLRAVQLLFTNSYVYFGSDAPGELNYIYRIDRRGENIERLVNVSSSVFYGCKVGSSLFFSTAVEPSQVNTTRFSEIWTSTNGKDWIKILEVKKDFFSMRYFQYGQTLLPAGPGDGAHFYCFLFSLVGHGKTIKIPISNNL
jgi:hypothetical protein